MEFAVLDKSFASTILAVSNPIFDATPQKQTLEDIAISGVSCYDKDNSFCVYLQRQTCERLLANVATAKEASLESCNCKKSACLKLYV